ncbi:hypothetical protein TNCV_440001 [Trichonephila clavipes]|nr:hypothetical protein TNCV_440001 [Trichonephila clavipes]
MIIIFKRKYDVMHLRDAARLWMELFEASLVEEFPKIGEATNHRNVHRQVVTDLPSFLSGSTAHGGPWPSQEAFFSPNFFLLVFSNS